jgi:hypothetical protein
MPRNRGKVFLEQKEDLKKSPCVLLKNQLLASGIEITNFHLVA